MLRALVGILASMTLRAPVQAMEVVHPVPVITTNADSINTSDWACIRQHESGDNYSEYNGGAYQFEDSTWESTTGMAPPAEDYSPATQNWAALKLYHYAQTHNGNGFYPWSTRWVCGVG